MNWTMAIALLALGISTIAALGLWLVARYMIQSSRLASKVNESMFKMMMHIGQETGTILTGDQMGKVPPNVTIH